VAARPAIAAPAALAAHVAAASRARAECSEWRCGPDEPEWLLETEATEDIVFGVARPSALEAQETLDALPEAFIDCQWPFAYLRAQVPGRA
jgi:hypothetical protein